MKNILIIQCYTYKKKTTANLHLQWSFIIVVVRLHKRSRHLTYNYRPDSAIF